MVNANESMNGVDRKKREDRLDGERGNETEERVNGDDEQEESGCAKETGIGDEEKGLEEEGEDVQKSVAIHR